MLILVLLGILGLLIAGVVYVVIGVDAVLSWQREERAIAMLPWSQGPWTGVDEKMLSVAVTTFVYGLSRGDVPGSHADAVRSRFGMRSGPLLELLDHCLRTASGYAAGGTPQSEVAARLRELPMEIFGGAHLTTDAAESLAAWAATHDERVDHRPPADDEIIRALRAFPSRSAVAMALRLDELLGETPLSEGYIVMFFRRAFPAIPLRTLREAAGWHRVTSGHGLSDEEFEALLNPWLAAPTGGRAWWAT